MEWVPVLSALATQPTYPTYPLYCILKVHKYFSLLISLYIYKNSWNWLTRPRLRGWPQLAKIRQTSQWSKDSEISITVLQQTVQKSRQIEAGKNWTGFFLFFFFRDVSCRAKWWRRPTNSAAQSGWGSFEAAVSVLSWGCWRLPTRRSAYRLHSGRIFKILSKNMRNVCPLNPSLFVCLIWDCWRLPTCCSAQSSTLS